MMKKVLYVLFITSYKFISFFIKKIMKTTNKNKNQITLSVSMVILFFNE